MIVKIPHSNFWVNPDFVAYVKPDSDDRCEKEWAAIHLKDGSTHRVYCSPEQVMSAIKGENEIANAISSSFSSAFGSGYESPAFLEAIAMALGFKNQSSFDAIASAIDGLSHNN